MILLPPEHWKPLADALRAEVQEAGWLLELLERQQRQVLDRVYEDLPGLTTDLSAQIAKVEARRDARVELQGELMTQAGADPKTRLRTVLDTIPPPVDGLFVELIRELERVSDRLNRRTRQNRLLLARAHEVTREIFRRLRPESVPDGYSPRGQRPVKGLVGRRALTFAARG